MITSPYAGSDSFPALSNTVTLIRLSGLVVSLASVKSVPAGTGTTNLPSRTSTFVSPLYQPSSFFVNVIGVLLFGKVTFIEVKPPIAFLILSTSVSALRVVPLFLSLAAISCFSLASSVKLGSFSAGTEINNSVGCFLSVFSPVTLSV